MVKTFRAPADLQQGDIFVIIDLIAQHDGVLLVCCGHGGTDCGNGVFRADEIKRFWTEYRRLLRQRLQMVDGHVAASGIKQKARLKPLPGRQPIRLRALQGGNTLPHLTRGLHPIQGRGNDQDQQCG